MFFTLLLGGCTSEELYVAYKDPQTNLYGIKNQAGKIVVAPQYEQVFGGDKIFHSSNPDTEYLVPVVKMGQYVRITKDGVIRFRTVKYDNGPDYYEEGLARFLEEDKNGRDKVGFHDRKGNVVIQPLYDFVGPFRNGYALVCKGCWNQETKPIKRYPLTSLFSSYVSYPPLPDQNPNHYDDYALKEGLWGAVDLRGKEVVALAHKDLKTVYSILEKEFDYHYMIKD